MAGRLKYKLPPLRVTMRSPSGGVSDLYIPRGSTPQDQPVQQIVMKDEQMVMEQEKVQNEDQQIMMAEEAESWMAKTRGYQVEDETLLSLHEISQKQATESWQRIRPELLRIAIASEAMPNDQKCLLCSTEDACCRCLQCGPNKFFCQNCFTAAHKEVNIFHSGEIWQNGTYHPLTTMINMDVRDHMCSSVNYASICVISDSGEEHSVRFAYCPCEPLVLTMVRARIWTSSPQRPQLAFTCDLLDWAETLLLECQVSVEDFCKAVQFKCRSLTMKNIYSSLIDAFEEYRWLKVELRHMTTLCSDLDQGNVCPACPKESGAMILSLDALFGLPRKKAAGKSHRDPLHGNIFFGNQSSVDEHVAMYRMPNHQEGNTCSNFLAGDSLRSSKRYHALDETAVFGCGCRHEHPRFFINLKHGERLSYVIWVLEVLNQEVSSGIDLYIMYDIACMLVKHLKANGGGHLLERLKFAVPSFHAYGHNAVCQATYSPLRCEGIGLSDGEVMERMWSDLRRFSRMTKEMRPSHRIDVLSHALLYYGYKSKKKLPSLLTARYKKAKEMKEVAKKTFQNVSATLTVPVTDSMVEGWISEHLEAMRCTIQKRPNWKSSYFHLLQAYYASREELSRSCGSTGPKRDKIMSLDQQLADIEKMFGVTSRWSITDEAYREQKRLFLVEKKFRLHTSLWATVVKRHYLLQMKVKYSDGQKIAKKLSSSITKETKGIKIILEDYLLILDELQSGNPLPSLSEVLCLESDFWKAKSLLVEQTTNAGIPWKIKQEVTQAFLVVKRSSEELDILEVEMTTVIRYWFNRVMVIVERLRNLTGDEDAYISGARSLLKRLKLEAELHHQKAFTMFSKVINISSDIRLQTSTKTNEHLESVEESDSDDESEVDSDSSETEH